MYGMHMLIVTYIHMYKCIYIYKNNKEEIIELRWGKRAARGETMLCGKDTVNIVRMYESSQK